MKRRIAVLGGGVAGCAAAFALSRTPELRQRYEVTVYQADARLGGKGATARDPRHGHRIEEHGLHVWMGFYTRAFRMMREVYEAGPGPWRSPANCFAPRHRVSFGTGDGALTLDLPPLPGLPWDDGPPARLGRRRLARWLLGDGRRTLGALARNRREARHLLALSAAIGRGLLADVLPHGWEALDDVDLMAWLRRHGADRPEVYDAPPIRGMYNLAFAYPDGVAGPGRGDLAAGPALRAMLRMLLTYRGAPMWTMQAGMGDTVFAPMYRVLRQRGVRFAWHHRVTGMRVGGAPGPGGDRCVDAVDLRVTGTTAPGFDPLVRLPGGEGGAEIDVWPARPEGVVSCDRRRTLYRGEDYDALVLAIPVPAHRAIAAELMAASPRYREMVSNSASVATVACQLWLRPDAHALGHGGTIRTNDRGLFSSYADLTETAAHERWPERPGHVAYFCDVHPDGPFDGLTPDAARARLVSEAGRWADGPLLELWPGARGADGRFDRAALLHGPLEAGEDPLSAQYFRVNTEPSERYVLTPAGSVRHRLAPEDSTFDGLFLAGDWTRTAIDGGSVEAAVESGQRAAAAADAWCREERAPVRRAVPRVAGAVGA